MKPMMTALTLLVLLMGSAASQQPKRPWTVDDVVGQEKTGDWTLSRDGRLALWVRSRPDEKKDVHLPTLMLTDVGTGEHRELTVGKHDISLPAISPEARFVSFLSKRPFPEGTKDLKKQLRGAQIWTLDLRGGQARPLTKVPFGVKRYQWIDEGTLLLTARDRRSKRELDIAERKDRSRVVEDVTEFGDGAARLFRFDVAKKKLTRLTGGREPVQTFSASDDGRFVVALHGRSPSHRAENDLPPRCLVHDLEEGTAREIFADRLSKPGRFAWEPKRHVVWCQAPSPSVDGENWGATETVFRVDAATGETKRIVDRMSVRGFLIGLEHGFLAGVSKGVRPDIVRWLHGPEFVDEDGSVHSSALPHSIKHDGTVFHVVKARDSDRVIWVTGDASTPDRVMTGRLILKGAPYRLAEPRELYRPNAGFEKLEIARTETVRWTGAAHQNVEGLLYYPSGYEEGKKYPLVLVTHGGPHGADLDRFTERWSNTPNLWSGRGAFVLKANYHGSSDYGLEWGESIKGRYYELEVIDLLTGIKHLEDRGLIDRERLGLVGWSNGAILSTAILAFGHRYAPELTYEFRACAPGAGDVNWTSDYGNCAFGASFDEFYLGGTPWSNLEGYLAKSPLMEVERITTPTIIFFGSEDTSVPTEQGWEWFRALHRVGRAPVRFVLFPGEGHGLKKLTHRRRKLTEELAWFDRYLFDVELAPPLVKDGSPLDVALRRRDVARVGDVYGVRHGDVVVPETVPVGEFEVGRFEVTAAQWAFFDDSVAAAGRENAPRSAVTAAEARAYVAWLRERTGEGWRLITAAEHAKLPVGKSENTLDRWAGYAPAPHDARKLRTLLLQLELDRVLWEVGTAPPGTYLRGDRRELLFDVGGNAAEWVLDGEELRAAGGSVATSPGDPAARPDVPATVIGLRVAKSR